ncbi:hypothetical protein KTQ83_00930 [Holdemanella porci]|nr:hypothetical protein [Holdemanella porci]MBU9886118.1 hypothetical protein [Holdemanella porci]
MYSAILKISFFILSKTSFINIILLQFYSIT